MSRKTLTLFYQYPLTIESGLSYETVDLFDEMGMKAGFLVSTRVTDNTFPPSPEFRFNPYIVNKSINLPGGIITFSYEVVNRLTVIAKPIYEAGFKNTIVTREIISELNNKEKIIKCKLIVEFDA